ncbi:MAG: V-type ATP synthase subunit K [Lentisphaerae bacterium]|jgi:V/A-type H+/Na+-transporting ATPase subunit K|nr:V-type ATP synthase subunit K [Lentisphaerota bacterium]MBT4821014.1 V-type ATP synthase subunit K [Lentisphaerota bacterium]MBT5607868.1 V-type ATP synthase subunit K [Lentisphaerota bacterium]MBT7054850.1 V-type ATP synthase subunit K [Lentisphaerota bacterium]MBT7845590.1 V-type ATP synthase subunit K [Lentisphaerota bacterium]
MVQGMGDMGLSLSLAAVGSALGSGVAAMAAIGVMKRKLAEGSKAPFTLFIFVGAPLSQLFYGMIFNTNLVAANLAPDTYVFQIVMGLGAGLAMGMSAFLQGRAGARACDALGETGKGLGGYIMAIGVIESVALLVMILLMLKIPQAA